MYDSMDTLKLKDYEILLSKLNDKQFKYLYNIMHLIRIGQIPFYHFLCGKSGAGKSLLMHAIYNTIVKYFHKKSLNMNQVISILTAPTGIAAFNIHGLTTNTAFALPFSLPITLPLLKADKLNALKIKLKDLKLIQIDEISMVGQMQWRWIDQRLRQIFSHSLSKLSLLPFGGISIIASGDFFQLPPVKDEFVYKPNKKIAFCQNNMFWELFQIYELSECMRQKDDKIFSDALDNFISDKLTIDQINHFTSRLFNVIDYSMINVFFTNKEVDEFNKNYLSQFKGEIVTALAEDILNINNLNIHYNRIVNPIDEYIDILKDIHSDELESDNLKSTSLSYCLELKIGILYRIIMNLDTTDGLTNGCIGILKNITFENNKPIIIWLEFSNKITGSNSRKDNNKLLETYNITGNLTPIFLKSSIYYNIKTSNYQDKRIAITRIQFPITICQGMTTYKVQSSTIDNIAIHLDNMGRDQIYVGLSRVKNFSNLKIYSKSTDFKDIIYNLNHSTKILISEARERINKTKIEMIRMKNTNPLILTLKFMQDLNENDYFKIISFNIENINYFSSIQNKYYESTDIIFLEQTNHINCDKIINFELSKINKISNLESNLSKFEFLSFNRYVLSENSIIYVNKRINSIVNNYFILLNSYHKTFENGECYYLTNCKLFDKYFIFVYKSVKLSYDLLQNLIENWVINNIVEKNCQIIIVGNLNIDLINDSSDDIILTNKTEFLKHMNKLKFYSLIKNKISTDDRTQTDICYVFNNLKNYEAGYFESFFSTHKPIWISIKKNNYFKQINQSFSDNLVIDTDMIELKCNILDEKINNSLDDCIIVGLDDNLTDNFILKDNYITEIESVVKEPINQSIYEFNDRIMSKKVYGIELHKICHIYPDDLLTLNNSGEPTIGPKDQ